MNINKIMNNTFQDNFAESMGLLSMLVDNDLKIDSYSKELRPIVLLIEMLKVFDGWMLLPAEAAS